MSVGKMIQQALKIRKMSQTELALKISAPLSTVNGYILGKYEPCYEKLIDIANALGVSINYLLGTDPSNILNEDELFILLKYRSFEEQDKSVVVDYIKFMDIQRVKSKSTE